MVAKEFQMAEIIRFGVSMDKELVDKLDTMTQKLEYPNRSEALRSLVRQALIQEGAQDDSREVTGVISLLFPFSTTLERVPLEPYPSLRLITNLQQHLDREVCIKILIVTGRSGELRAWASQLIGQRKVMGQLTIASTDELTKDFHS